MIVPKLRQKKSWKKEGKKKLRKYLLHFLQKPKSTGKKERERETAIVVDLGEKDCQRLLHSNEL